AIAKRKAKANVVGIVGLVENMPDGKAQRPGADAVDAGILTEAEASLLRLADQATDRVIRVDDFDPDELAPRQLTRYSGTAAE
ncbi:MAG: hypothetical protein ACO1OK_00775, partial [Devosia sp.]